MSKNWEQEIKDYCYKYNIPLDYLAETIYEPKVVPMIRGKAFEFSAMLVLKSILKEEEWEVTKEVMNAQLGSHDVDVKILHKPTGIVIAGECKLASKGDYKYIPGNKLHGEYHEIRVKCMRSRTLGPKQVKTLAPAMGVDEDVLAVHNDQYRVGDFDIVVCSIGNAFYETDKDTGMFEWMPTEKGTDFLKRLGPSKKESLKDFAFRKMYLAKSSMIVVGRNTGVICTRKACKNKTGCGFIPDYPILRLDKSLKPVNGWIEIANSVKFFREIVKSRSGK